MFCNFIERVVEINFITFKIIFKKIIHVEGRKGGRGAGRHGAVTPPPHPLPNTLLIFFLSLFLWVNKFHPRAPALTSALIFEKS